MDLVKVANRMAATLFEKGIEVFSIHNDGTKRMVSSFEDVENAIKRGDSFGVEVQTWNSLDVISLIRLYRHEASLESFYGVEVYYLQDGNLISEDWVPPEDDETKYYSLGFTMGNFQMDDELLK